MYLTRFDVNPVRRGAHKLLGSPQAMHAAVLAGFPPGEGSSSEGRVLWRVDGSSGHTPALWIVSPAAPDLTHLVEQAGWPTQATWTTRDYRPLLGRLKEGQEWTFRLTANTVRHGRSRAESVSGANTSGTTSGRTQPYGHVSAAHQERWLTSRLPGLGFRLVLATDDAPALVVRERRTLRFRRGEQTVTLRVATFDGRLAVTDPGVLRSVLVNGIGRAKGYGCGLLTLAP